MVKSKLLWQKEKSQVLQLNAAKVLGGAMLYLSLGKQLKFHKTAISQQG